MFIGFVEFIEFLQIEELRDFIKSLLGYGYEARFVFRLSLSSSFFYTLPLNALRYGHRYRLTLPFSPASFSLIVSQSLILSYQP